MAGRKIKLVSFEGKNLHQNGGGSAVRVGFSKGNNTYILWDGKRRILTRRNLPDIAAEYYKYIGQGIDITKHISYSVEPSKIIPYGKGRKVRKLLVQKVTGKMEPAEIAQIFADLYRQDPIKMEILSGIIHLSKLSTMDWGFHTTSTPTAQISMDEILQAYLDNPAYDGKTYALKQASQYWTEFRTIINRQAGHKVKNLSDINPEWVKVWEAEINKVATQPSYTTAYWLSAGQRKEFGKNKIYPRSIWQRKRIYGIRGLLNHYSKHKILDPNNPKKKIIDDLLYVLSSVTAFKKSNPLPKTMTPETFQQLYNSASDRMKIMLALSVQCAFTNVDLYNLKKDDINWETGELNKMREKEKQVRLAHISPFIIKMMQDYLKKNNGNSEYVMISKGTRITAIAIRKEFAGLREQVGLDTGIQFKQLRKTALTTAAEGGASEISIKLLAGHSRGILTHYIPATIKQVKKTCEYIAQEYFTHLKK